MYERKLITWMYVFFGAFISDSFNSFWRQAQSIISLKLRSIIIGTAILFSRSIIWSVASDESVDKKKLVGT